jgi:hypothetical protein
MSLTHFFYEMILKEELWLNLAPSNGQMNHHGIASQIQYQQVNIQSLIQIYGRNCKAELGKMGNCTTTLHLTHQECLDFCLDSNPKPKVNVTIEVML